MTDNDQQNVVVDADIEFANKEDNIGDILTTAEQEARAMLNQAAIEQDVRRALQEEEVAQQKAMVEEYIKDVDPEIKDQLTTIIKLVNENKLAVNPEWIQNNTNFSILIQSACWKILHANDFTLETPFNYTPDLDSLSDLLFGAIVCEIAATNCVALEETLSIAAGVLGKTIYMGMVEEHAGDDVVKVEDIFLTLVYVSMNDQRFNGHFFGGILNKTGLKFKDVYDHFIVKYKID